ncbi:MAG: patatin family protein [Lachnospiraceae bacterium]|nr:patatin family protein [Lachnospiraceae bacterium]
MHHCGLILEGGGMRGVFTAGVLDYFMDKHLMFSDIYGVSAGSCHACSYISGQRRRAFSINVDYLDDKRYCSLKSLLTTGDLFGADMLYHQIPDVLNLFDYHTYDQYQGNFYAVLTDCETGKPVYAKIGDLHQDIIYIRASSSLPLVSRMVKIDGHFYLDGGISDSIPVIHSVKSGQKKNVVILTQPAGYRKSPNKMAGLIRMKYREFPKLAEAVANRHLVYNQTLDYIHKEEAAGNLFVIRPEGPVNIGRIEKNREKLENLYLRGYDTAKKQQENLMKFLEK